MKQQLQRCAYMTAWLAALCTTRCHCLTAKLVHCLRHLIKISDVVLAPRRTRTTLLLLSGKMCMYLQARQELERLDALARDLSAAGDSKLMVQVCPQSYKYIKHV